jgi:uncharacterized protein YndB with AHSA1/START domain
VPTVKRSRTLSAPVEEIWRVVGDVHHLPRWWPGVERVEGSRGGGFTQVLRSKKGRTVRQDFRITRDDSKRLRRWEQEITGTPFERFLAANAMEVALEPAEGGGATKVTLTSEQKLRGVSRVGGGGFMLRRATKQQLGEALDGLESLL